MTESQLRKSDFLASLLLLAFSLAATAAALAMPRYSQGWYAAPGFPPFAFGSVLGLMSLALLGRTLWKGGWRFRLGREHWLRVRDSKAVRRVLVMGGFIALFLLLFGRIPFLLLSFGFLLGTIHYFRGAKPWQNLVISAAASLLIWYVFAVVFMVPLR